MSEERRELEEKLSVLDPEFQKLEIFQIYRRLRDFDYLYIALSHLVREKPDVYLSFLRVFEYVRKEIRRPG